MQYKADVLCKSSQRNLHNSIMFAGRKVRKMAMTGGMKKWGASEEWMRASSDEVIGFEGNSPCVTSVLVCTGGDPFVGSCAMKR